MRSIGTQGGAVTTAPPLLSLSTPTIDYGLRTRVGSRVHQMGNGTLMVYNMSQSDTGMYECVAKRGRERRTTRTQLKEKLFFQSRPIIKLS